MHLLVLLQPQCTHTQFLLLATVLVFHSLTAFVSSLPQVQTSHAALGGTQGGLSDYRIISAYSTISCLYFKRMLNCRLLYSN